MKRVFLILFVFCFLVTGGKLPASARKAAVNSGDVTIVSGDTKKIPLKVKRGTGKIKIGNKKVIQAKIKGSNVSIQAKRRGRTTLFIKDGKKTCRYRIQVISKEEFKKQKAQGLVTGGAKMLLPDELKGNDGILLARKAPNGKMIRVKKKSLPNGGTVAWRLKGLTEDTIKQYYFRGYVKIGKKVLYTPYFQFKQKAPGIGYFQ